MTSVFNPAEKLDDLFLLFILIFIYFIVLPYFTNGKTIGKWILHFRVKGLGDRITFIELCKRYGMLYYGIGGINYVLLATRALNQQLEIIFLLLFFIFNGSILLHFALHIFKRDKRLFYEKMSKTYNVITFKKNK
ncbi:RDD family protein [Bacillus cereus]|nr:RDD family protein [Bacillus cereus]